MKNIMIILALLVDSASNSQTLKITTGTTLKTTGGALITVENLHLDNDGTINQVIGDGTFRFSGNTNTSISGTTIPIFDYLAMAKTNAQLSLLTDITITSGVDFTSGLLNLNNHTITLQPSALLNGESETSRITGNSGGYVEITTALNAPSSVNPGNLGVIITSSQNLGNTVIRRGHVSQTGTLGNGSSILRYYDIVPSNNIALNATLRFKYFDAELNSIDENTMVFWKSSDMINWINQGFSSRDAANNYLEKTGITDFSRWTLSSSMGGRFAANPRLQTTTTFPDANAKYKWLSWPNPVTKTVWITITVDKETKTTTRIFDNNGTLVSTRQYNLTAGKNILTVEVKQLAAGNYYIISEWDDGRAKASARFVKL